MGDLLSIVKSLISRRHEEEWFEFKENWFEPHALGEYISGMSNAAAMAGEEYAYFVWGIEDNTHAVKGTSFDIHQDVKNEPMKHYLARMVKPDIGFDFHEAELEGKRIVVLVIPAAKTSPTAFDRVRYLRIGSSKVNLMEYPEREAQLFDILKNGFPTIENTESEYQDLTFSKLFVYYEAKGITLNKRTFKKNLGLLTKNGKYNVMAQLLSDNSHIPIRFSLFSGETKATAMYSVREFGNTCLLYSLDDVLRYGEVLNIPQADERNRVVERFFAGESVPVNQKLSDIFLQLHISERSGRGVPKITEVYGEDHIELRENSIVVTIPYDRLGDEVYTPDETQNVSVEGMNVPVDVPVATGHVPDKKSKEELLIEFCYEPKTALEVAHYLGYKDKRSARKYLDVLLAQGRIAMTIPDKPNSKNQKYVTIK